MSRLSAPDLTPFCNRVKSLTDSTTFVPWLWLIHFHQVMRIQAVEVYMQALTQLAQDCDSGNAAVAVPIMYTDETAYLVELA